MIANGNHIESIEDLKILLRQESRGVAQKQNWILSCEVYSDQFLNLEREHLLETSFVPLFETAPIANPGDFREVRVGSIPFIGIRQDSGEIRVFRNECRHRGHPVTCMKDGNMQTFRCAYHGWTYGRDGANISSWANRKRGMNLGLNETPCIEQFGLLWKNGPGVEKIGGPWMQTLGAHDPVFFFRRECEAHWKFILEANLEVSHVHTVHPTTLAPTSSGRLMQFSPFGSDGRILIPLRSLWSTAKGSKQNWRKHVSVAHLIFPSTIYLNVADKYAVVVHLEPQSSKQTTVSCWILAPRMARSGRYATFLAEIGPFVESFVQEDLAAAERVQSVHGKDSLSRVLGAEDVAIVHFHAQILDRLKLSDLLRPHES